MESAVLVDGTSYNGLTRYHRQNTENDSLDTLRQIFIEILYVQFLSDSEYYRKFLVVT